MQGKLVRVTVFAALLCCFFIPGTNSWSAEKILNIYFCGTGATDEWHIQGKPAWHRAGGNALNNPTELIASLYQNDDSWVIQKYEIAGIVYLVETTDGGTHYKYIANGLGTDFFSLIGQADPDFGARGWDAVVAEAYLALDLIADEGDGITLNLIGFSRGGILTMKMARKVANDTRVAKINILAYDPVPGGTNTIKDHGSDLRLPAKVNQFVGIYASDERTYLFDPVIPDLSELNRPSKYWLTTVPGGHETMVGNCQIDGHSLTVIDPFGLADWSHEPRMLPVNRVATVVAEQLLTSWEWGEVPLHLESPYNNESSFLEQVDRMYEYDYSYVRITAFLPLWSTYDKCYAKIGGRDHHLRKSNFPWVTHGRLAFRAPHRHSPEWAFSSCNLRIFPLYFPRPDQVYWLSSVARKMNRMAWRTLQALGGNPPPDTTPPEPTVDPLPTISDQCFVSITAPPTAFDAVDGTINGTTIDPLTYTEQGTYTVTWTYTDGAGNSATQDQVIVVEDTIPPIPDADPLSEVTGECSAEITSHPTATDNCVGPVTGSTSDPLSYLAQGDFEVTWTYDDGNGNIESQIQSVMIHDVTPPVIESLSASPDILWPPNHKMKEVAITAIASDNCTETPSCHVESVSSNEAEDGSGDGHTPSDWEITGDLSVKLRAERSGSGNDRQYVVTVACGDDVGITSTGTIVVVVPHDRGRR